MNQIKGFPPVLFINLLGLFSLFYEYFEEKKSIAFLSLMFLLKLVNLIVLNNTLSNIIRDKYTISTLYSISRNILIVLTITHLLACAFLTISIELSKSIGP